MIHNSKNRLSYIVVSGCNNIVFAKYNLAWWHRCNISTSLSLKQQVIQFVFVLSRFFSGLLLLFHCPYTKKWNHKRKALPSNIVYFELKYKFAFVAMVNKLSSVFTWFSTIYASLHEMNKQRDGVTELCITQI